MSLPAISSRILVVQSSRLGDLVLATPVFAALKQRWPAARLTVMVGAGMAPVLQHQTTVDQVLVDDKHGKHFGPRGVLKLVLELRRERFDVALSLHRGLRTAMLLALAEIPLRVGFRQSQLKFLYHRHVQRDAARHDVERQLSILDALGVRYDRAASLPRLDIGAPVRAAVDELLARAGLTAEESFVVLAPGASWRSKRWLPERWAQVAAELLAEGNAVVFVGGAEEESAVAEIQRQAGGGINLAGQTDVAELAAVIARAAAIVCCDSAAMHMAQAVNVPLVAVVGPTCDEQGFMPRTRNSRVLRDETLTCRPVCRFGGMECPLGTRACMHSITTEHVLAALADIRSRSSFDPEEPAGPMAAASGSAAAR